MLVTEMSCETDNTAYHGVKAVTEGEAEQPSLRLGRVAAAVMLSTAINCGVTPANAIVSNTAQENIDWLRGEQRLNTDRLDLKLLGRVRHLASLTDGWCGEGSVGPTNQAICDAENFIRTTDWERLSAPYITAAADGEINFWWDRDGVTLDLGFFGDGSYAYFAKIGKTELLDDEVPVLQPLNHEIIEALSV